MAIVGQNYYTGNDEVRLSLEVEKGKQLTEGQAVSLNSSGRIEPYNGSSFIGFAGQVFAGFCSVISSGLMTYVVLKDGATAVVGKDAYLDATGVVSDTGTIKVGTFTGKPVTNATNSKCDVIPSAVAISFDAKAVTNTHEPSKAKAGAKAKDDKPSSQAPSKAETGAETQDNKPKNVSTQDDKLNK